MPMGKGEKMTKEDMIDTVKVVMSYLYKDVGDTWYGDLLSDVLEELMNNGDAEPVAHAHIDDGRCTACGTKVSAWASDFKLCPYCGAKMDKDSNYS